METEETTKAERLPRLTKRFADKWARFTERSNKEFQALPPEKKRVSIAMDVIAQLKAKALKAEHGTYVQSTRELSAKANDALEGKDLGVAIPYFGACNVCAVGSVMICTIMRDDNVSYEGAGLYAGARWDSPEPPAQFPSP